MSPVIESGVKFGLFPPTGDHVGVANPEGLEYHLMVINPGAVGELISLI